MHSESPRFYVFAATLIAFVLGLSGSAIAFDLNGAWAEGENQCNRVFTRGGRANQVTFSQFSGGSSGGFIAEREHLRSKVNSCTIKSRKDDGQNINIVVGCTKGVVLSNVQFFLKIVDDNNITRVFPGIDGMDVPYHRCNM